MSATQMYRQQPENNGKAFTASLEQTEVAPPCANTVDQLMSDNKVDCLADGTDAEELAHYIQKQLAVGHARQQQTGLSAMREGSYVDGNTIASHISFKQQSHVLGGLDCSSPGLSCCQSLSQNLNALMQCINKNEGGTSSSNKVFRISGNDDNLNGNCSSTKSTASAITKTGKLLRDPPKLGESGNWRCEMCSNVNYPRRNVCNRCKQTRSPANDIFVNDYNSFRDELLGMGLDVQTASAAASAQQTAQRTGNESILTGLCENREQAVLLLREIAAKAQQLIVNDDGASQDYLSCIDVVGSAVEAMQEQNELVMKPSESFDHSTAKVQMRDYHLRGCIASSGPPPGITMPARSQVSPGAAVSVLNGMQSNAMPDVLRRASDFMTGKPASGSNAGHGNSQRLSYPTAIKEFSAPAAKFQQGEEFGGWRKSSAGGHSTAASDASREDRAADLGASSQALIAEQPMPVSSMKSVFQAVTLMARTVSDQLIREFEGIGDANPSERAADVLRSALVHLGMNSSVETIPRGSSLASIDQLGEWSRMTSAFSASNGSGVGSGCGSQAGVPLMLAHPDEFKNPSSFLKIYGDPLCGIGSTLSTGNPMKNQFGNWLCVNCKNVNYPRRFRCNKCNEVRGEEGDKVVLEYAKIVYAQHMKAVKERQENCDFSSSGASTCTASSVAPARSLTGMSSLNKPKATLQHQHSFQSTATTCSATNSNDKHITRSNSGSGRTSVSSVEQSSMMLLGTPMAQPPKATAAGANANLVSGSRVLGMTVGMPITS